MHVLIMLYALYQMTDAPYLIPKYLVFYSHPSSLIPHASCLIPITNKSNSGGNTMESDEFLHANDNNKTILPKHLQPTSQTSFPLYYT